MSKSCDAVLASKVYLICLAFINLTLVEQWFERHPHMEAAPTLNQSLLLKFESMTILVCNN